MKIRDACFAVFVSSGLVFFLHEAQAQPPGTMESKTPRQAIVVAQATQTPTPPSVNDPVKREPVAPLQFEPPPVPEFMLRKPSQPLTMEEMQRQVDEANKKAQRARATNPNSTTNEAVPATR
ncbi:MAG: hypothetical protein ACKVQK_06035 [Burkholderiales bacterium]